MVVEKPDPLELDFKTVFRSEAGERVLRHLMDRCFIWDETTNESSLLMANNEGQRMVVLYIMRLIGKKMELPTEYADEAAQAEIDYPLPGQDQNA